MFRLWRHGQGQQKTHSRFQPWVLVKVSVQQAPTASLTTTTTRMTACDAFFNIADSIYPNPLPGQDLIETLDCHGCISTLFLMQPVSTLSLIHISEPTRLGMISYA